MKALVRHAGQALPIDAVNVDTDVLVPKQYLKRVERSGLADYLFDRWRYLDRGQASDDPYIDCAARAPDPDFALNQARYRGATVLLARANFGCGSSREQAVWALAEFGIRVLAAPSFGDIFFNNCLANGVLPVVLPDEAVDRLFAQALGPGCRLVVDLPAQTVADGCGGEWRFTIDAFRKASLLAGRDAIADTLSHAAAIAGFERVHREGQPWLARDVPFFNDPESELP